MHNNNIIGCVAYCEYEGRIVGLDCSKGRGTILPGGKWEYPESFHDCAVREFKEETGLECASPEFLFFGIGPFGCFVYTFRVYIRAFHWKHTEAGITGLTTWDKLFKSQFGQYYRVLQEVIQR